MSSIGGTPALRAAGDPIAAIENAIHAWVTDGSRLAPAQVSWGAEANTGAPQPDGTYISMRMLQTDTVSADWLIRRRNESGGVVDHVRGTRHETLEITCFAAGRYGGRRASKILSRVAAAVLLPDNVRRLRRARVGIGTYETIRVIEGRRSGQFDPRAVVEFYAHFMEDVRRPGREWRSVGIRTPHGDAYFAQTVVKPV